MKDIARRVSAGKSRICVTVNTGHVQIRTLDAACPTDPHHGHAP